MNILDTDSEKRFDRITRTAKRMFNVPIALVSLVDEDRLWFKSALGLDAKETPRDVSFCQYAIRQDSPYVISDTLNNKLFCNNPLVTDEPSIRFYAGIPIKAINGEKLGTLCIIDQSPREFSDDDVEALSDLALIVEKELNMTEMVMYDDLTELLNRRGFIDRANETLKLCKRYDVDACIVYLDLDKFKLINDTFGHTEGDNALKIFANALKKSFRDTDICARIGGDEFALLLHNTYRQDFENIMTNFKIRLNQICNEENARYEIEFSYGMIDIDNKAYNDIESLLHHSDTVMYKYKQAKNHLLHAVYGIPSSLEFTQLLSYSNII